MTVKSHHLPMRVCHCKKTDSAATFDFAFAWAHVPNPWSNVAAKKKVPRLPLHADVRYRASPLKTTCSFNHRQGAFVAGTVFTFTPTNSPIEVLWQLTVMWLPASGQIRRPKGLRLSVTLISVALMKTFNSLLTHKVALSFDVERWRVYERPCVHRALTHSQRRCNQGPQRTFCIWFTQTGKKH